MHGRGWSIAAGVASAVGSALGLAALWNARELGLFSNALFLALLVAVPALAAARIFEAARQELTLEPLREPRRHAWLLGAFLLRAAIWLGLLGTLELALIPAQFTEEELWSVHLVERGSAAVLVLLELVPRRRVSPWSTLALVCLGLLAAGDVGRAVSEPPREAAVELASPFEGEFYVFQGGGGTLLNHHTTLQQQFHALDLITLTPEGRDCAGDPTQLASYACFGVPILSPAAGTVAAVVSSRPDMAIGEADPQELGGNSVVVQIAPERYVLLAHLQAGSVRVQVGQRVAEGEPLARCGNSGNTSAPHLHLQVQNRPTLHNDDDELYTFPIHFKDAVRIRGGARHPGPCAVRRNDRVLPRRGSPAGE